MKYDQTALCAEAAARFRTACPDLVAQSELDTVQGLLAAKELALATLPHPHDVVVAVVIGGLDLTSWTAATCTFALGLAPEHATAWRRSLTRTLFLAGNPANLLDRFPFAHLAGECAWTTPGPAQDTVGLRRLLKAFEAPHELPVGPPVSLVVPPHGAARSVGGHREMHIAASGVSIARALVHINHLLVEAVLDGRIAPGDRLTLRPVPHVFKGPYDFDAVRVDIDTANPDRLRVYAALTRRTNEPSQERRNP
ncbi:DUF6182 family protein [Streptomyces sp. NK08204]|uniref:DUF6182 family protein n=1 Tax=Streptomyces sp. NK08204 TaxID=2873260 RepID=UPI001CEC4F2A|nr:DUF6182 family protein [Streptomyces sp. NK08204]